MEQKMIQSVSRAMSILELVCSSNQGLALGRISSDLGLNKSTAHHLIGTLTKLGYIRQNPDNRKYGVGHRLVEMGHQVARNLDIVREAESILAAAAEAAGETAHLMILDRDRIVYLQKVDSPDQTHGLQLASRVGLRVPAHSTAGGKVMLAHLPPEELKRLISRTTLAEKTDKTITDPDLLIAHLAQVRRQGYAIDDEENETGVRCAAAPVRDAVGRVAAAVTISGPSLRMTEEYVEKTVIDLVISSARELSRRLGWRSRS